MQPNLNKLELDITYACGMGCRNCNRMTSVAKSRPTECITPGQIETLVADSVRLSYKWSNWCLIGGEPTTHPDLDEIVRIVGEYRTAHNPSLVVTLATHGNGEKARQCIADISQRFPWITILNSHKSGPDQSHHIACCVAPADIDPLWASTHQFTGCYISHTCGIGCNYAGFFPCAVAGAIDRVFGLGQAIRNLADVNEQAMRDKWQVFCRLCGFYRPIHERKDMLLSPSWREAIRKYNTGIP